MDRLRHTLGKIKNDKQQLCKSCHLIAHGEKPYIAPRPDSQYCSSCGDVLYTRTIMGAVSEDDSPFLRRRDAWPSMRDVDYLPSSEHQEHTGKSAAASSESLLSIPPSTPSHRRRPAKLSTTGSSARPTPTLRRGDAFIGPRSPTRRSSLSPSPSLASLKEDIAEAANTPLLPSPSPSNADAASIFEFEENGERLVASLNNNRRRPPVRPTPIAIPSRFRRRSSSSSLLPPREVWRSVFKNPFKAAPVPDEPMPGCTGMLGLRLAVYCAEDVVEESQALPPMPQLARRLTVPSPSRTHFHASPFAEGREGREVPSLVLSPAEDGDEGAA
ncbi:hypothetical protein F5B20DRAFT_582272 [Whalleya microplaca]|nr:hypothetical protein F5B20DRAFT_582272 [Whalleya microplaca]